MSVLFELARALCGLGLALAGPIALGSDALRRHRAQIEDRRHAFGWTVAALGVTSLHPILVLLGVAESNAFLDGAHLIGLQRRQSMGSASVFGLAGALLIGGSRPVHRLLGGLILASGAALFILGTDLFRR